MTAQPTTAMYSVLLGGYETLNEQPALQEIGETQRFLLTDDPDLSSDFWQIVHVEPAFATDPVRSQRLLKILGHPVLDDFERTLYVDNAVELSTPPAALLDAWLGDHALAAPLHSYRARLVDEFDEVLRLQYDDPARIYEQLVHYARATPDVLERRPHWTAILGRRRGDDVAAAMRTWADHVLRYSRRDQLSVEVALEGLDVASIEIDNMASEHHRWPVDLKRRVEQGKAVDPPAGPLAIELTRMDRRLVEAERRTREAEAAREELERERDEAQRTREEAVALREQAERDLAAQARDRQAERARAESRADERAQELRHDFERSASWRLTAPLRYASSRLRKR